MWCIKIAVLACLSVGAFAHQFSARSAGNTQQQVTPTPSIDPVVFCGQFNSTDCDACINARQPSPTNSAVDTVCFYCAANQQCRPFTENTVFPFSGLPCPNLEYYVGTCASSATPSIDPNLFCGIYNGTCDACINARQPSPKNSAVKTVCFYCAANQQCRPLTENTVLPFSDLPCPNLEYNVGTCALTALIIAVLMGLTLLLVVVINACVCCCCCIWCALRRRRARMIEDDRYVEEKDEIRQRATDRRQERKAKTDEIRRKYGLH